MYYAGTSHTLVKASMQLNVIIPRADYLPRIMRMKSTTQIKDEVETPCRMSHLPQLADEKYTPLSKLVLRTIVDLVRMRKQMSIRPENYGGQLTPYWRGGCTAQINMPT